jgi:hypothetical protein
VIPAGHATARIFTQRLRASNARGQRIWFDKSLKRVEKNKHIYPRVDSDAFYFSP